MSSKCLQPHSEHAGSFSVFHSYSCERPGILLVRLPSRWRSHFYIISDRSAPSFDVKSPATGPSPPSGAAEVLPNTDTGTARSSHRLALLRASMDVRNKIRSASDRTCQFLQPAVRWRDFWRLPSFTCHRPTYAARPDLNAGLWASDAVSPDGRPRRRLVSAHSFPGCVCSLRILWGNFYRLHFLFKKLRKVKEKVSFYLFINKIAEHIGKYLYILLQLEIARINY